MSPSTYPKIHFNLVSAYNMPTHGEYKTNVPDLDIIPNTKSLSQIKMTETGSGYHYEIKIPGYIKEDFNFYKIKNDLVLTTEKREEIKTDKKGNDNGSRHSYCYASAYFKISFHLPNNVDCDEIFVDYNNEILSFDLLKSKKQNQHKT